MSAVKSSPLDRRAETRVPAEGKVEIWSVGPPSLRTVGQLMDVSSRGFRARHDAMQLSAGQRIRFRHGAMQGAAAVMWNRVIDEGVESGFLILSKDELAR